MGGVVVPGMKQKDDALTTVLKGLQIAQGVYGIKSNMAKLEEEKARAQDKARGIVTPVESLELQKTHDISGTETPGAQRIFIRTPEGDQEAFASLRKPPEAGLRPPDPISERRMALEEKKFAYQREQDKAATAAKSAQPQGQAPAVKLNSEERKRLDSASMGLSAVKDMGIALAGGSNTFSIVGDNDFTAARARFEEALGRMQSGGAITDNEASRFAKMAPTFRDSAEMQQKKMAEIYREMALRVKSLGADPEEILANRDAVSVPSFGGKRAGFGEAQAAGGFKPGSIVESKGKRYRIGADGDTMTEIQ